MSCTICPWYCGDRQWVYTDKKISSCGVLGLRLRAFSVRGGTRGCGVLSYISDVHPDIRCFRIPVAWRATSLNGAKVQHPGEALIVFEKGSECFDSDHDSSVKVFTIPERKYIVDAEYFENIINTKNIPFLRIFFS